ncbi:MAG: aminoacyl-tRNA hydrolase [Chloroflexi bacterium]|nr:aminoacyl-tRNA hydrolase [Chloroflexota bacterium]
MIIVMGLGNPGKEYAVTRHNVGFWCVDALASKHRIPMNDRRTHVVYGQGQIEGVPVVLAKPRTYMNRSGQAAKYLLDRFQQSRQFGTLLVVHDDMDLPVGKIRLRPSGSAGGHNGIRSIIAELGTQDFPRLRIGIGHPQTGDAIGFVLGRLTQEEAWLMEKTLALAEEAVAWTALHGLASAMNRYNQMTVVADA